MNKTKVFVTKVEIDPETNQISLLFPPGFMQHLNLIDGEFLVWEFTDSAITIKKKAINEQ